MKQLLQNVRDGKTEVVDVPVPSPKPGMVLVQTAASLVSAGTERMLVEFAEKSLLGKARSRPDLVRQVIDKARREGIISTVEAALNRLDQPLPLGYSSAGTIREIGSDVQGFKVGQRVACAGGGYAVHAEFASVPKNLVAPLPKNVDFESGAFGTMGSIAMHGLRLAQPQLGETVLVIGLGVLGLLSVNLAQAAGCRVFGVDLDPNRVALAKEIGAEAALRSEAEDAVQTFTQGQGADVVLICADSDSSDPVELAGETARERGRVVAVGVVGMQIPRRIYFAKELEFIVSRSYGPGRYDHNYEEGGRDYPLGYVRWTAGRNLASFVNLLGDGKIDIAPLITHRFSIAEASAAYDLITGKKKADFLGVLLTYSQDETIAFEEARFQDLNPKPLPSADQVNLGVVGAGGFANAVMLPTLKRIKNLNLVGIVSASGLSAQHAAKKYRFAYAASETRKLLEDPAINAIAVLTRHHLHTPQIIAGLQAGKHVFCEKPLAINAAQLDELKAELQNPDLPILMPGFNRRFAPMALKLKSFISESPEPLAAHYRVNASYLPPEHWHHDLQQGGGRIISEACHFIDLLGWLVGQPPVSVRAVGLPDAGKYYEDNVFLNFEFPNGSVASLSYLANGDKSFSKERLEVFAGGRVAVLDDFRSLKMIHKGRRKIIRSRLRQDKGHRAEWNAFVSAVIGDGIPPIPYRDMLAVTQAALTAVDALHSGEKLKITL